MGHHKFNKEKKYYEISFYVTVNGKRKQVHKRGFPTVKAAKDFEREYTNKYNNSVEMSFQSLYELYIEYISKRVKERTLASKKSFSKQILPFFKDYQLNAITPLIISKWQNELLGKGLKNNYVRSVNANLKAVFNYADKFFNIKNPMTKLDTICQSEKKELSICTVDEFNTFLDSVKKPMYKVIFLTLFWTGARVSEVLALTYGDLDFKNSTILINKSYWKGDVTAPKTKGSIRKIKIPSLLNTALEDYTRNLYGVEPRHRIFEASIAWLNALLKNSNLKNSTVHDLRHSHASILIGNGANIVSVSKRLGHSNPTMTLNVYAHLLPDGEDKLIEKLENLK